MKFEILNAFTLKVLKILHNFPHTTSIFDDFVHYEKRQEETEHRRVAANFKVILNSDIDISYMCE